MANGAMTIELSHDPRLMSGILRIAHEVLEHAADEFDEVKGQLSISRELRLRLENEVDTLREKDLAAVDRITEIEEDLRRKVGMTIVQMADLKQKAARIADLETQVQRGLKAVLDAAKDIVRLKVERDDLAKRVKELESLEVDRQRDYDGMREFQAKYIAADRKYRALADEFADAKATRQALWDAAIKREARVAELEAALRRQLAEAERYKAALEKIANGDVNDIHTPLGSLHHAGIALQWEIDAKICREALKEPPHG